MLRNYLLVTVRGLLRNKAFSFINILGLAIGIAACFLIFQYVRFEQSYDRFHHDHESIYRVAYNQMQNGVVLGGGAANFPAIGPAMKSDLGEVAAFTRMVDASLFTSDLTKYFTNSLEFSREKENGDLIAFNEESVFMTDGNFLSFFSFPLVEGNAAGALAEPNTVAISESVKKRYFGQAPAVGKTLRLNRERVLTVSCVFRDVPGNSHLQFDILMSLATVHPTFGDGFNIWSWTVFYTYVKLDAGVDPGAVTAKFPDVLRPRLGAEYDKQKYYPEMFLQPLSSIHLQSSLVGEQSPTSTQEAVYFLTLLAVFIMLVAWINYINLSAAKALERSKEVGLRKVVGATRTQLIVQFIFDSVILNCLAALVAIVIVVIAWPSFEQLVQRDIGKLLSLDLLFSNLMTVFTGALVFSVAVIIVSVYPAAILSSFKPAIVLKGKFLKSSLGGRIQKGMVSFQYVLSFALVGGTILMLAQLAHMRAQDPGYVRDQIVVLSAPAVYDSLNDARIVGFKVAAGKIAGVHSVSSSVDVPGERMVEESPMWRMREKDAPAVPVAISSIDTGFFATYNIKLVAGRLFTPEEKMWFRYNSNFQIIPVVVNEEVAKQFGRRGDDFLGEHLEFSWGPEMRLAEVVGVVANHHQVSFKEPTHPVMYIQPRWSAWRYISVNLDMRSADVTLPRLQQLYREAFPGSNYSYFFLDEFFDRQYHMEEQFGKIFSVFAGLAIFVTCMGIVGLALLAVSQRTKEVGIRKVLGATITNILALFTKDFVLLVVIALVVATPLIFFAGEKWLENFTYRIPVPWQAIVVPFGGLLLLTICAISFVTLRTALTNVTKTLRQE